MKVFALLLAGSGLILALGGIVMIEFSERAWQAIGAGIVLLIGSGVFATLFLGAQLGSSQRERDRESD